MMSLGSPSYNQNLLYLLRGKNPGVEFLLDLGVGGDETDIADILFSLLMNTGDLLLEHVFDTKGLGLEWYKVCTCACA
jgi:hypothetical protein